jgi:hypothetical protein
VSVPKDRNAWANLHLLGQPNTFLDPASNDTLCALPHPPPSATCYYPVQEDLLAQVKAVKATNK